MTEEIRYIANLQRQEEFDNKVTELEDELKRSEQENKELKEKVKSRENELANMAEQANMRINNYRSALKEIRTISDKFDYWNSDLTKASNIVGEIIDKINEVLK